MIISVINHTKGKVSDEELQVAIRAINRQIAEDFAPYWHMQGTLRLEGRSAVKPSTVTMPDLRGEAILYLWDEEDVEDALGYHLQNFRGIPYGFVFTSIAEELDEPWSVTLSHEALELLADPETNLLVMGPHPNEDRYVFHWFEMCDAVQAETYEIDGVPVSNFVLPLYFTGTRETDEPGARNDFLGRLHEGAPLASFGVNPGGYVGFYDPKVEDHVTFAIRGDRKAARRRRTKARTKATRRSERYRRFQDTGGIAEQGSKDSGGKRSRFASSKGTFYAAIDGAGSKSRSVGSGRSTKTPVPPKLERRKNARAKGRKR